ncbi:N-acetylmuramoyl-L-alanine amidase [Corynebacterium ulcerans]|uniref:peptidoglycan recognition protein family protein n=1 Tax=Corynebacterium TaxID=1716 RepID=UPI001303003C|nr:MULTISPECIES: N-acetylmuramoyl-L-alanine amidase [Corynebacterium]MBL4944344.1 N-acetylmuramoyl-L-alanine amidase [Corynebacterium ulcerans]QGZ24620.1 N-acetylmuramoyl-L-alanine amidase [Corynebacterium ulcerans]QOE25133.1 N-acetylmuramoyl-L-alanine amidase [Corynebacterium ulcerans]CAB0765535.1 N-acetylmuramoyl-L-alanine amidase [Corynebacterium diphtheriae]CAB0844755.1 N-acetylmuramoyl-L-alanine amidase [Corynebacterium diphtheriae]
MKPNPAHRGDPLFLPEVLRAFGVKVQEWPGWKDRGHGDFGVIQGVFAHHTGTNKDIPGYIASHPDLGLCSQIHLNRDGTAVIVGAGIAWHAGQGSYAGWPTNDANRVSIGIEAASDGTSPWPQAQLDAYYRCCAAILWYLGKPATPQTLLGHKEYSGAAQGKWDPGGIDMDDFRKKVQHYIDNPPLTNPHKEDAMGLITSLINPKFKFTANSLLSIIDAACWQSLVLLREIAKKQGIDPDMVLEDAIRKDREEKK